MMDANYCVLCQDAHTMSLQCVALNALCKGCGERGHVRKDCPKSEGTSSRQKESPQSLKIQQAVPEQSATKTSHMKSKISEEEKEQIIQECVEDQVSPVFLAKKWNCSAQSIRTWVRSAGKQLPKKYKKTNVITQKSMNTSDTDEDILDKDLLQDEYNIARRLLKRKCNQDIIPRKAMKLAEVNISTLALCNSPPCEEVSKQSSVSPPSEQVSSPLIAQVSSPSLRQVSSPPSEEVSFSTPSKQSSVSPSSDQSSVSPSSDQSSVSPSSDQSSVSPSSDQSSVSPSSDQSSVSPSSDQSSVSPSSIQSKVSPSSDQSSVTPLSGHILSSPPSEQVAIFPSNYQVFFLTPSEQDSISPLAEQVPMPSPRAQRSISLSSEAVFNRQPDEETECPPDGQAQSPRPVFEARMVDYSMDSSLMVIEVCDDDLDENVNIICNSDDVEHVLEQEILQSAAGGPVRTSGGNKESSESSTDIKAGMELKNEDDECPDLNAGKYTIISVHIELFRSSKFSFSKITQIGCTVDGVTPVWFFKAIKPSGIEEYLDHYKLGGDLLQALHMTREDDGTFLFRSRFEAIEESEKEVCIEEREALESLLKFLQEHPNCVIVGVDEDTIAILVKKLQSVDSKSCEVIRGFTYWKRVLKYLDVDGYKNIDLEEYYTNMDGKDLPSFNAAWAIASVLMNSVKFVANKEKGGRKSMDADFFKLCRKTSFLSHPQKIDHTASSTVENVEVYSSFRPSVSATFTAEKLEQILVASDTEPEPEEMGQSQAGAVKKETLCVPEVTSSDDMDAIAKLRSEAIASMGPQTRTLTSGQAVSTSSPVQPVPTKPWQIEVHGLGGGTVKCTVDTCKSTVLYKNILKHITKVHPKQPTVSKIGLLCPVCKVSVSPKALQVHLKSCVGTVICPSYKCKSSVRLNKIFKHMAKVHPTISTTSRLCTVCKTQVLPSAVAVHMRSCSRATATTATAQVVARSAPPPHRPRKRTAAQLKT